jgi:hypothetical protein
MSEITKPTSNQAENGNKSKPLLAVVFVDKTGSQLNNGDIINLHQTVNGESLFIVLDVYNLDVRYAYNLAYKYQYDTVELLSPSKLNGDIYFEIVGNLYPHLENYR